VLFLVLLATFATYDRFVSNRNRRLVGTAERSEAIVSSIFPSNVRERLFADDERVPKRAVQVGGITGLVKGHLADKSEAREAIKAKPIADLFLSTTIMFADIVGFTAWSSTREPSQVR
jgi:hypothetical protein